MNSYYNYFNNLIMRLLNLCNIHPKFTNGVLYHFSINKKGKLSASQIPFNLRPAVQQQKVKALQQIRNNDKNVNLNLRSKPGKFTELLKQKLIKKEDQKLSLNNQANIATTYYQSEKERISNNLKTRNFFNSEYSKGQQKLQNVPLDPFYEYKLAEYEKNIQQMHQDIRDFKLMRYNNVARSESLVATADGYDQKLKKYEYERFMKKVKQYPGSINGSTPQQDPDSYGKYLWQNMPNFLKSKVRHEQYRQSEINGNLRRELKEKIGKKSNHAYIQINDYLNQNQNLQIPETEPSMTNVNFVLPYSQIPLLPNTKFMEYQDYMLKVFAWARFRSSFYSNNFMQNLKKAIDRLSDVNQNQMDDNQQYYEIEPTATSLSRYYHTLPMNLQQDPGVKNTYIGLQYSCGDWSMQKKEDMLNKAAMYSLPLDSATTMMMEKHLSVRKTHMTPEIKDKIFSMPAAYTWQIKKFLAELKQQKLRSVSNIQERKQVYKTPPQVWKQQVTDVPRLPVDYYDNDDGFWTEHITTKLARYDKARPINRFRKEFTH